MSTTKDRVRNWFAACAGPNEPQPTLNFWTLSFKDSQIARDLTIHKESIQHNPRIWIIQQFASTVNLGQALFTYFYLKNDNLIEVVHAIDVFVTFTLLWNILLLLRMRRFTKYIPLLCFLLICIESIAF